MSPGGLIVSTRLSILRSVAVLWRRMVVKSTRKMNPSKRIVTATRLYHGVKEKPPPRQKGARPRT